MSLWEPAPAPVVSVSPVAAGLRSHPLQRREAAEPAGKGEPGFYSAVLPGGALQLQARKGEPFCPCHWLGFGAFLYLMAGADGGGKVIQNLHFYRNGDELG